MSFEPADMIWTLAGFALLGLSLYMLATRVIMPRFGSPLLQRVDRGRALERSQALLDDPGLDEETRFQLQMRVNTLRARDAHRESWSGRKPDHEICREIDQICEQYEAQKH